MPCWWGVVERSLRMPHSRLAVRMMAPPLVAAGDHLEQAQRRRWAWEGLCLPSRRWAVTIFWGA